MKITHRIVISIQFLTTITICSTAFGQEHQHHAEEGESGKLEWRMPMGSMSGGMPMLPGMGSYHPPMTPYLPGMGIDPMTLPLAQPKQVYELADGDTIQLTARPVRRTINGRTFVMFGFNGQYPGPLIRVKQEATIIVDFTNQMDLPTTIHWHGLRLDNRFDGVPGLTQDPILPGARFVYQVYFPDAGIYWYHPHVREDIQQELGLYGNLLVDSPDPKYYNPVNREEVIIFDDILMDRDQIVPFGMENSNYTLMGRFGNIFLVNGEPEYELNLELGEVVRFMLTNVSNTRIYNLVFGDAPMKIVGADVGKFEREEWIKSVVIAPAQRYIVEARFERPGKFYITNRVQTINHFMGEYYPKIDTIGSINVSEKWTEVKYAEAFETLRENRDVITDIDKYRPHFDRPPDRELLLSVFIGSLPQAMVQYMSIDTSYFPPIEWSDTMPMMNWVSNGQNINWILRDMATGKENMDIEWEFEQGDVVKIRLFNDPNSMHPMSHPIHLHGQRFLVISRDGVPNRNLVWKDTVLVPVGSTVDILLDVTNPGKWMMHCHIAEHLESGMMSGFTVK